MEASCCDQMRCQHGLYRAIYQAYRCGSADEGDDSAKRVFCISVGKLVISILGEPWS